VIGDTKEIPADLLEYRKGETLTYVKLPVAFNMKQFSAPGLDKFFLLLPFCPDDDLSFLVISPAVPLL